MENMSLSKKVLKSVCHRCVIVYILLTTFHVSLSVASISGVRTSVISTNPINNSTNKQTTSRVHELTSSSQEGNKHNNILDRTRTSVFKDGGQDVRNRTQDKEMMKPVAPNLSGSTSGAKRRPVRSPQQGTDPLFGARGSPWKNQPPMAAQGDIQPTMAMDLGATVNFPQPMNNAPYEHPETHAEQRDDELEEMLDMLILRGYTGTVLPDNMSMYPDIMNYTEAGAGGEEAEEAGEGEEGEEYEADEHYNMMTVTGNFSDPRYQGKDDEWEEDEGLQPSGRQFPPHKVHNMSQMASKVYDPYFSYGYKFKPKENKPHENIQPTPVLTGPSDVKIIVAGQASVNSNATAGSQAKISDVKTITKHKVADFGGLSASTTFGIVVGSIFGFWLVMGPMICILMKVRDQRKERQKRFLIGPRSNSDKKSDRGIMEAMIMTELGKLPFGKGKKPFLPQKTSASSSERMSLTDDKETETFHDAIDSPVLLP